MGPVPRKDADEALRAFMDWFRAAVEDGQIILGEGGGAVV